MTDLCACISPGWRKRVLRRAVGDTILLLVGVSLFAFGLSPARPWLWISGAVVLVVATLRMVHAIAEAAGHASSCRRPGRDDEIARWAAVQPASMNGPVVIRIPFPAGH